MFKRRKIVRGILISTIAIVAFGIMSYATETTTMSIEDKNRLLGAVAREWESSNLREWLNSDKTDVDYTAIEPSYKDEAGFLSDTNFTQEERDAIAVTRHGGGWQYSLEGNENDTLYISRRSVAHNDFIYNDKVFILHYTDMVNFIERNNQLLNENEKYYSDYLKNITNKENKYDYLVNSGYVNKSYTDVNEMYSSTLHTLSGRKQNNIVPALSLKPDYTLSNGIKAKDLDVGSKVIFGKYNGEPIEWQVINKSDNGYPLLWSTKIIMIKEYDARGDINPLKSDYINFDTYEVDIASDTGENKSWETDEAILSTPVITIENESVLTTPTTDTSITIKIKATDDNNSIRKIILPDGSVVNGSTAEYTLSKNGEYDIIAENSQGVITVRHIITKAINTPAEVTITTDKDDSSKWTNKPVTVTVSATNNGAYTTTISAKETGYNDIKSSKFPDWVPLGKKRIRITGTLYNKISDSDIENYNLDMDATIRLRLNYRYYTINKTGNKYELYLTYSLAQLKEDGEIYIDEILTMPKDVYSKLSVRLSLMDRNSNYMRTGYNWGASDFNIEVLDKDDLKIEEITFPDGNVIKNDTSTYTIFEKGIYTFSARDNRDIVTSKTIELDIDMVNPELDITYPTDLTENNITLNINATDDLSGIKSIKLPNGEYRTNSVDEKPLSVKYNITENGNYTFETTDFAGNKVSKTIVIDNIDKNPPTLSYTLTPNTWTNGDVSINLIATDTESGFKEIILPNGNIVKTTQASYIVDKNGVYYFHAYDNINHLTVLKVEITNIDTNKPSVLINKNPDVNWTNEDIQITITGSDK